MGKGDKKSRRGKLIKGTFGNSRPKRRKKVQNQKEKKATSKKKNL